MERENSCIFGCITVMFVFAVMLPVFIGICIIDGFHKLYKKVKKLLK